MEEENSELAAFKTSLYLMLNILENVSTKDHLLELNKDVVFEENEQYLHQYCLTVVETLEIQF